MSLLHGGELRGLAALAVHWHLAVHKTLGLRKALSAFRPTPTFSSISSTALTRFFRYLGLLCSVFIAFLAESFASDLAPEFVQWITTIGPNYRSSKSLPSMTTDSHSAILVRVRRRQAVHVPGPLSSL
ncbi:hypothetical protein PAXRUDRAFT_9173 [Paxillus rubicundulus Ve08.2h10]|uniref:Uncharacterized protein n=1 Tax=Paxillus rubicundulus Ve08.2h10 TaxID=930991 RepID=A0A0D0EC93_9AGAM|nr:hypothetical protein PAXRUDRAFT_9173 [Paxillus rubicundulus Ve08.2h10]